ncbi:glucosyl-3-phosphoglycerate synthase [Bellilinea sp.]|uniref:glucosyl-3-phosphoglycerate synthase n=1 Tax=Bellilinea sp. TaxID=2838785 RepID=UPI002ADE182C|nr:glucosyl-3-phosphoglycerate synthase [Bellilinea sp.]
MYSQRIFRPFRRLVVPVFNETVQKNLINFCNLLEETSLTFLGVVEVDSSSSLSAGNASARKLRKSLYDFIRSRHLDAQIAVSVAYDPWDGINSYLQDHRTDLVILDWSSLPKNQPNFIEGIKRINANVAIIRGNFSKRHPKIGIPLRGGPHAQLSLRLALAMRRSELNAIHLFLPETSAEVVEAPLLGISRILPSLPEVNYQRKASSNPLAEILELSRKSDVTILGIAEASAERQASLGKVADQLLEETEQEVVVVKTQQEIPRREEDWKKETIGSKAISILVDKWFAENTFHASEFDNIDNLVRLKEEQGLAISLALPALNEEETVGNVIGTIQKTLIEKHRLLDEIVLMDSNSTDRTREIAESFGIPVYIHQQTLPQYGAREGKGEALWKSLYVTKGDIIIWIDSDIVNIHPRFVYGVVGPLLLNRNIHFVKGFYQRPLKTGRRVQSTGGGRVTELTARPLINLFYPELSGVIQPLSGEYGGRRKVLENLTFFTGYGVETGLLIDVFEKYGLSAIAQVDLLERIHHNQSLTALSKMSFVIIQAVLKKLEGRFKQPLFEDINRSMKIVQYESGNYFLEVKEIIEQERPPMITLPEYRAKFYPNE